MNYTKDNPPEITTFTLVWLRRRYKETKNPLRWGQYLCNQMNWTYPELFYAENLSYAESLLYLKLI